MVVRIADIPESDRPRERLVRFGLNSLSERELIALVIGAGGSGKSALDIAADLLSTWGSVEALTSARIEDLTCFPSIGTARAAALLGAFELGRRSLAPMAPTAVVRGPEDLVQLVKPLLLGRPHEEVVLVVMNAANKPTRILSLTRGGAVGCLIPVRDVLSTVLRNDGVAFAVAHIHPSGNLQPSQADIQATQKVASGAAATGLSFVDHIIVTSTGFTSIRDVEEGVVARGASEGQLHD